MPELPEVETIRRDLSRVLRGRKIQAVAVKKEKMVHGAPGAFGRKLRGQVIRQIKRRGKLLIVAFDEPDLFLLIHLKMTGQLIYRDGRKTVAGGHGFPPVALPAAEAMGGRPLNSGLPNKYTHIVINFASGGRLYFNDMRQFGFMEAVDRQRLTNVLHQYGVEPLGRNFTWQVLRQILKGRKVAVKSVLLDQKSIAGLGNIYADESCFMAGLRPTRRSGRVTQRETVRLHRAIGRVLRRAIAKRGTTFGSYRDGLGGEGDFVSMLNVYGRAGKRCKKCKAARLKRVKVGGRGTVYCPTCQM